ncbi:MAG: NADH-quinone oxidoreductase subunit NuoF [Elusimicrobiota bacterium]|nr:NADH-quinone oxidoreductase subunit NuoF [Elusimicrobiota bacterium]
MRINTFEELEKLRQEILSNRSPERISISIAGGTCGFASGVEQVIDTFKETIKKLSLDSNVELRVTGCRGFCAQEPIVVIYPQKVFYVQVKPENVEEILLEGIIKKSIVKKLLYIDSNLKKSFVVEDEIPFYKNQERRLLRNNGEINPTEIEDYLAIGGYSALAKALKMNPEEIIEEVKKSGLRGRGGAGFPTGRKWSACRNATSELIVHSSEKNQLRTKYIICNADEGDPGAFMDRSLLEGNPHSVIEGMIIGAWAICGKTKYKPQGYVYVRNEYPLAVKHLQIALEQAREYGFLGENILGTDFSFDIKICRGGGAFVCGEESALLASVEGKLGESRPRPPYPAEKGLFGQPTNINNVKTWASIPLIISNGAEWFSSIGTETSKGTMIFSLVGKINNTGLVEVPMGIKLRELIYDIGGGIPNDKKFKAVQTGGPSGGCIPESLLDLPVDYEALTEAGSMMGSGGMIVMDEDTCMVEVARYFLDFTQQESCGKCTPCREGTKIMLDILTRITQGKGCEGDIELLEEIATIVKDTSLCALGGTAPNPVLTTIRYFRSEYELHIKEKKCPAKVCKALITYSILSEKCNGCHVCFKNCPQEAIVGKPKEVHTIDQDKCIKCGICFDVCKFAAVKVD